MEATRIVARTASRLLVLEGVGMEDLFIFRVRSKMTPQCPDCLSFQISYHSRHLTVGLVGHTIGGRPAARAAQAAWHRQKRRHRATPGEGAGSRAETPSG